MNGCIYCNEYDVCMKYTTDKATSFCAGRNCRDRKPSNSDRIRSMTDEELAEWLEKIDPCFDCFDCRFNTKCNWNHQVRKIDWLEQEAK